MSSSRKSYRSDLVNFEKNEENIIPTIDTDQKKEIISTSQKKQIKSFSHDENNLWEGAEVDEFDDPVNDKGVIESKGSQGQSEIKKAAQKGTIREAGSLLQNRIVNQGSFGIINQNSEKEDYINQSDDEDEFQASQRDDCVGQGSVVFHNNKQSLSQTMGFLPDAGFEVPSLGYNQNKNKSSHILQYQEEEKQSQEFETEEQRNFLKNNQQQKFGQNQFQKFSHHQQIQGQIPVAIQKKEISQISQKNMNGRYQDRGQSKSAERNDFQSSRNYPGPQQERSSLSPGSLPRQSMAPSFAYDMTDQQKQPGSSLSPERIQKNDSSPIDLKDIELQQSYYMTNQQFNQKNVNLAQSVQVKQGKQLASTFEKDFYRSQENFNNHNEVNEQICDVHNRKIILFCLKCQEQTCEQCLDTMHLLHPVVPLSSVNKLDFKKSLKTEIEKNLEDIRVRESLLQAKIGKDLTKHKIALRNNIISIRDQLRQDFDDFFNQMLSSVREDWNLFQLQEQLSKETRTFSKEIITQLAQITQQDEFAHIYNQNDLKKFYENLSDAQSMVQDFQENWNAYEQDVDHMVDSMKGYSEFDIIEGATLKNYLAENLVMNYSNIEIHKLLFQRAAAKAEGVNNNRLGNQGKQRERDGSNLVRGAQLSSQVGIDEQQNISFNRNSQLAMANNYEQTGIRMVNKQNDRDSEQMEEVRTNKIHFFKFDQKIVTFYNVDHERKQREVLNIDFNIPIRFCSIQTNDGRIFITGGAKNTSQSSNHAYEFRNGTLIQLPNMINPREGHCLAAVGNSQIYAIGSRLYNTSKTCEVYSIENNCWREKPELNRNRYLSTAVTIQQRYIYVFGGYEPLVTDIERLDTLSSDKPFWELIKVWSTSLEADVKYWFGACAISQQDILIFGGKKDGASSSSSYIFDTAQNQIVKTGNLPNKDTFYQRTFICKNNKVYAYGYENDQAYIYDIKSKSWIKN